jgi:TonB family protein
VDLTQPPLDLPELAEALVTEDLFTIPTAPKIEEALRPIDPTPPKPIVKKVAMTQPTAPRRSVASSNAGTSTGGGIGSGGTGGGGNGKFVIPRPPYPSSLKAMGIQGSVRLKITVGTSGRASSVSVIGTSGNSTLDQYAAGWVRRNGKAPAGDVRTVIAPLSFVLN